MSYSLTPGVSVIFLSVNAATGVATIDLTPYDDSWVSTGDISIRITDTNSVNDSDGPKFTDVVSTISLYAINDPPSFATNTCSGASF